MRIARYRWHGVTATPTGVVPTAMSVGSFVLVFTSIVDTELPLEPTPLPALLTKRVLPSAVSARWTGDAPTAMTVGTSVLVVPSMVDTESLRLLATKAVLPSGVTTTPTGNVPTVMSVGSLVLVFTSIVDTVPLGPLVTKAVTRHRGRAGTADTPPGATSAPANPTTTTP